jgi:hypothetical protein
MHDILLNEINYKRLVRPGDYRGNKTFIEMDRQFLNVQKVVKSGIYKLIGPEEEDDDSVDSISMGVSCALNDKSYDFKKVPGKKRSSIRESLGIEIKKRIKTKMGIELDGF